VESKEIRESILENMQSKRSKLRFAHEVEQAFDFLVDDYDMRCVESGHTLVSYESKLVFVDIYHEPISYELRVEIGLASDDRSDSYSLAEVLQAFLGEGHGHTTFYQSSSPEGVRDSVKSLAELLHKYYGPALRGEQSAFESIELASRRIAEKLMLDMKQRDIRAKAIKAWQAKDYATLAQLYESIKSNLTNAEKGKLEYALKHM